MLLCLLCLFVADFFLCEICVICGRSSFQLSPPSISRIIIHASAKFAMRSVWFFNRFVVFVLGAALLCAPLSQTRVGSQTLANGERDRPPVALAHFFQAQATAGDHGVLIEWRTGFEPGILGFNLYRNSNGQRTQINPGLINGSALIMRQAAPLGSYAW